ncbi:MAG: hypothetical protein R3F56_21300 [Planctomycetota bacterium]
MSTPSTRRRGAAAAVALLAGILLAPRAAAQADATTLPPDRMGIKAPTPMMPACEPLAVPPPPLAVLKVPKHALPPIPIGGPGNPQPTNGPAREADPVAPAGTGAFTYFQNRPVLPTGASRSAASVVEPCAVNLRDTAMSVGNWYAALSRDHGQTWTNIFPQSFFPALDAGFCCDQRIDYVRSHDITVWLLQYGYSTTTRKGSYQIAVANGRDELRGANPADWTLYQFDPTDFGFPLGTWLDFPDVGFNDDWLYLSANVYDGASSNFVGAVVWRVSLFDLQNGNSATFSYLTDATMGGNTYRFATRAGDGTGMYWATLMNTTTIRVWYQNTIGVQRNYVDRTTAAWQFSYNDTCIGPDNRGWLGRSPIGLIRGACGTASELVFAWTSDGNGTTRPHPYTRVARLRVSDRSLLAEHDIYSADDCWAYAALDSNSLGDVGGVIAIGGANRYVRTSAFLIDQYDRWSAVVAYRMGDPTNNPSGQAFGDYFDVQRSWVDERTFIGAGTFMNGGDSSAEPHYTWFGRNDYEPAPVGLAVASAPVAGVPLTIDVTDINGLKDGTTGFRRTFLPRQGYALTAPYAFTTGGTTYIFERWVHDNLPQPEGELVLTVADMGTSDDTAEARYRARRTLDVVTSSHITTPVGITVTPRDLGGQFGGFTPFSRQYVQGTQVTLTMPAGSVGGHPFKQWRINNVAYPVGQLSVTFTVGSSDFTATAVFLVHTPGTFTAFGSGCAGSNGTPTHFGVGQPEVGQTIDWGLTAGPAQVPAVLVLGASNTLWQGLPLPLPLPGAPGCNLQASMDVIIPTTTLSGGATTVSIPIPNVPSLIGGHVFTQFACVDLAINQLGITVSNGLDTRVGGSR